MTPPPISLAIGLLGLASGVCLRPPRCVHLTRRPVIGVAAISMSEKHADALPNIANDDTKDSTPANAGMRSTRSGRKRRRSKKIRTRIDVVNEPVASRGQRHCSPVKFMASRLRQLGRAFLAPWVVRSLLRKAWNTTTYRGMVSDGCIDFSIVHCTNDLELVTRVGKEMEYILETYFDAPSYRTVSLPDKMRLARTADGEPLNACLQKRMRSLVRTRNALVHKRDENEIRHRRAFLDALKEVLRELEIEANLVRQQRQGDHEASRPSSRKVKRFVIISEIADRLPLVRTPVTMGARSSQEESLTCPGAVFATDDEDFRA